MLLEKIKTNVKPFIDIGLLVIVIIGSLYAYDEYKVNTQKIYVVDAAKIFELKKQDLNLDTATEDEIMKFYDELENIVQYSTAIIESISLQRDIVVFVKNSILTSTQSDKVVDLTDEVTMKLKEARLIK
ncbi:MAG: hypothetical protein WCS26_07965 [Arcobacteraceae bacterium]